MLFNSLLERDLEDAILRELEHFLLELGAGFTFVACQKRLQIDNDDFYIDLLFYNRRLKRLVAIEMKLGEFKAADEGQMELYLRWLAKQRKPQAIEDPPAHALVNTAWAPEAGQNTGQKAVRYESKETGETRSYRLPHDGRADTPTRGSAEDLWLGWAST
ncbi:YhcG PDDEXK nuclease domain-containing protein [Cupriavidus necator]